MCSRPAYHLSINCNILRHSHSHLDNAHCHHRHYRSVQTYLYNVPFFFSLPSLLPTTITHSSPTHHSSSTHHYHHHHNHLFSPPRLTNLTFITPTPPLPRAPHSCLSYLNLLPFFDPDISTVTAPITIVSLPPSHYIFTTFLPHLQPSSLCNIAASPQDSHVLVTWWSVLSTFLSIIFHKEVHGKQLIPG